MGLPRLDARAGAHFTYADLCHCSETWKRTRVDNTPRELATYEAMARLCAEILDPLAATFGVPELTYGFAGAALSSHVNGRIAPRLDQHAGHERSRTGALICPRLGQAVDLRVSGVAASAVGRHIAESLPFDRLYVYGDDRPLHVSCGPDNARAIVALREVGGRRIPRALTLAKLTAGEL